MLRFGLIPNLPGETKCRLLFLKNTNRKLLQIVPRIAYFESSNSWPKNLKPLTKNPIEEFFLLKQETAISYACVQTRDGDFLRMRFVYHHHHQHHQHCNYQPAIIVLLLVISPDFSLESNIEADTGWGAAGAPGRERRQGRNWCSRNWHGICQIYKYIKTWISDRFPLLILDLEQLVRVEEKLRLKICLNIAPLHYAAL